MILRLISQSEEFKSCVDLANTIPGDVDIICGIPRHGMIAASIIAEILGKPLTTPGGKSWFTVSTKPHRYHEPPTILIIDDSIGTGKTMAEAKDIVSREYSGSIILTATVFAGENARPLIDYCAHVYSTDTNIMFHSQFMHFPWLTPVGYDMDGVICQEWVPGGDYNHFLTHANPYRIPTYKIDYIITGRLPQFRQQTEDWLKHYQVEYDELIMLDNPAEYHGSFKARMCRTLGLKLFIESARDQAMTITKESGCPCLWYDGGELFQS